MSTGPNFNGRTKVLIADDSPDVVRRLVRLIAHLDRIELLDPVRDGMAALVAIELHRPEIAVLDLQMPRLTGLDVLREIRRRNNPCTVIMLTNDDDPETRARCLAEGAGHFLSKSEEFDLLPSIICSLTDSA